MDGDTTLSTHHLEVCLEPGVSGHPALLHHLLGVAQDAPQPHPGQCARVFGYQLQSDDDVIVAVAVVVVVVVYDDYVLFVVVVVPNVDVVD